MVANKVVRSIFRALRELAEIPQIITSATAATTKILLSSLSEFGPTLDRVCQNRALPTSVGPPQTIGEQPVSDDKKSETTETPASKDATVDPAPEQPEQSSTQSGPTFTEGPDPLAGVKKGAADAMASMEGKTVSMKVYVGSIVAVIVLMLLARCSG